MRMSQSGKAPGRCGTPGGDHKLRGASPGHAPHDRTIHPDLRTGTNHVVPAIQAYKYEGRLYSDSHGSGLISR